MSTKESCLCVKLKLLDTEERYYVIARASLEALTKYTTYCKDAGELLALMPKDGNLDARSFIQHFSGPIPSEDTFIISSSELPRAKKREVLYKDDIDALIVTQKELDDIINHYFRISLDDCDKKLVPAEKEKFLRALSKDFIDATVKREMNYNAMLKTSYDGYHDKRYYKYIGSLWMALGLIPENLSAVTTEACKNFAKKIELVKLVKDHLGDDVFNFVHENEEKRVAGVDRRLAKARESSHYIREQICVNVSKLSRSIRNKEASLEPTSASYELLDKRDGYGFNSDDSPTIRGLRKLESLIASAREELKANDNPKLTQALINYQYQLDSICSGNGMFSDAGFFIEDELRR
ncbi:MAG: hypothetical protein U0M66_03150 [Bacilli bacterium]|nr:hypothetical protein [Bacilli bacterium]